MKNFIVLELEQQRNTNPFDQSFCAAALAEMKTSPAAEESKVDLGGQWSSLAKSFMPETQSLLQAAATTSSHKKNSWCHIGYMNFKTMHFAVLPLVCTQGPTGPTAHDQEAKLEVPDPVQCHRSLEYFQKKIDFEHPFTARFWLLKATNENLTARSSMIPSKLAATPFPHIPPLHVWKGAKAEFQDREAARKKEDQKQQKRKAPKEKLDIFFVPAKKKPRTAAGKTVGQQDSHGSDVDDAVAHVDTPGIEDASDGGDDDLHVHDGHDEASSDSDCADSESLSESSSRSIPLAAAIEQELVEDAQSQSAGSRSAAEAGNSDIESVESFGGYSPSSEHPHPDEPGEIDAQSDVSATGSDKAPAAPAAAADVSAEPKDMNPSAIEIPGYGVIRYYAKDQHMTAFCETHKAIDCRRSRTCKGHARPNGQRSGQGRPIGVLTSWLMDPEFHEDPELKKEVHSLPKRQAARAHFLTLPNSATFSDSFERPKRPHEPDEPPNIV